MHTKKHTSIRIIIVTLLLVMGLSYTGLFQAGVAYAAPGDPPAAGAPVDPKAPDAPAIGNGGAGSGSANLGASALGNSSLGDVVKSDDIIIGLSKILAIALRTISQLVWPLLMFGSGLLKSDFLYTGAIDIKLTEMWIQVRNLVNIIYVILLLAVALYNVLGLGETVDFLEIKKALPKIILGLLLVNFSYAGVKVVLDVVNVGTTFAFSLPRTDPELSLETAKLVTNASENICQTLGDAVEKTASSVENTVAKADADKAAKDGKKPAGTVPTVSGSQEEAYKKAIDACITDKKNTTKELQNACVAKIEANSKKGICVRTATGSRELNPEVQKILSNWNIDGALMIMAVKFMRMQDLSKIAGSLSGNVTIANLAINMLFSLVMYFIYAISFIVLIIVLFVRAAILWMVIVFSPLIVVNMTFPNLVSQLGGGGDIAGKIVKTLIAPIIIGFVLSIGYILLSTMQNVNYDGVASLISDVPTSNLDTFQDFMIAIGSVVFVWLGVEGAINGTIGESVAGTIMTAAKGAGGWLAKAPFYYTPLFQIKSPHGTHHETVSMGTLAKALDIAKSAPDTHAHDEAIRIFGNKGGLANIVKKEELNEFMKGKDAAYFLDSEENRNQLKTALDKIKTKEGIKDEGADKHLLLLKKELDAGDKFDRTKAASALRDYKKAKGIPDVAESASKPGAAAAGGATEIGSFADKKANEAKLKDGAQYLSSGDQAKANGIIGAADEKAFTEKSKDASATEAAKRALVIADAKEALADSDKMKKYRDAVKSGKDADIQKAADELKPELDKFMSNLATNALIATSDGDAQAKILGDVLQGAAKKDGIDKKIMADKSEAQIKRLYADRTSLGNNIGNRIKR